MDLEKIASLVASRTGPLLVDHRLCSRVRSPLSRCTLCLDICPVQAISISKGRKIILSEACLECGLCAAVCPTAALKIQEPTELELLSRIEKMGESGTDVVLGCGHNRELGRGVLTVPCLGALSREFLFALDKLTFPIHVVYSESLCDPCPIKLGGDLYIKRLAEVRSVGKMMGLDPHSINNVTKPPAMEPDRSKQQEADNAVGRRAFFKSMWGGAKQVPLLALDGLLGAEPQVEKGVTEISGLAVDRIEILKKTVDAVDSQAQLPLLDHPQLQSACYFCRTCVILCPVGALKCAEGDKCKLFLHTDLCVGCGLCAQVCFHKSLVMQPAVVADLRKDEPKVLAIGEKKKCSGCGQGIISSGEDEKCPICRKKDKRKASQS